MNTQSREEFNANWDRQVGCPDQYDRAASDAVWSAMLASDPGRRDLGHRRAPRAADHDLGLEPAMVGKTQIPTLMVAGVHDKQVPPERVRELYADLGAPQQGLRRPRLLVAQRDVGEESPAAVPRLARMADDRNGERHVGRHAAGRLLMKSRGAAARVCLVAAIVAMVAVSAFAQRRFFDGFGGPRGNFKPYPNTAYDGRFNFIRVKYAPPPGGYWYRGLPSWAHGYPHGRAEPHEDHERGELSRRARRRINTITLDDPELFRYPVAYIIEVSWWQMTDTQAAALRTYMQKGGFVIVDDFKAEGDFGSPGWGPFEQNMRRVLPGVRFVPMRSTDPIFHRSSRSTISI